MGSLIVDELSIAEVCRGAPEVSESYMGRLFARGENQGRIGLRGTGRGTGMGDIGLHGG